jgi:1-acyl-sn-glycerol-3-phosphate acyltransferase
MNILLGNLYYYPLKLYLYFSLYLYFRKLRVVGRKNIPAGGPVIFASNHQNALLDALLISVVTRRNPHFLTRADVFKRGFLDHFLRGLKMLPIYRMRDGYNSIKKNEAIFNAAKGVLQQGGVVGIFPEGSHSLKYMVRPLKKGIARIAFMAEESRDFQANVHIVPVGIQYENHALPEGRTLVSFGRPLLVSDFIGDYIADKNKAVDKLINDLHMRMQSLVVHIDSPGYDDILHEYQSKRVYQSDLQHQLRSDQKLVEAISTGAEFKDIPKPSPMFFRYLRRFWDLIWRFIAWIPRKMTDSAVARMAKDPHFHGTMQFGISIIIYPLFFLILYQLLRLLFINI